VVLLAENYLISPETKTKNEPKPRSTKQFPSRGGVRGGAFIPPDSCISGVKKHLIQQTYLVLLGLLCFCFLI